MLLVKKKQPLANMNLLDDMATASGDDAHHWTTTPKVNATQVVGHIMVTLSNGSLLRLI